VNRVLRRISLLPVLLPLALAAQPQSIEISMERYQGGVWKTIDPGQVLDTGDLLRFRFRTTFDGYLYVIDSGTSGSQSLLFPGDATGRNNQVLAGREYFVPSTGASFQIAGPPGHDVVYWLLSPVPLGRDSAAALGRAGSLRPAGTLTPRCDDSIFRARGLCIDSSAGPRAVRPEEELPEAISSVPKMNGRELVIVQKNQHTRVSAPSSLAGPVVYEFRVSHH
jgi:hypothetical protein